MRSDAARRDGRTGRYAPRRRWSPAPPRARWFSSGCSWAPLATCSRWPVPVRPVAGRGARPGL